MLAERPSVLLGLLVCQLHVWLHLRRCECGRLLQAGWQLWAFLPLSGFSLPCWQASWMMRGGCVLAAVRGLSVCVIHHLPAGLNPFLPLGSNPCFQPSAYQSAGGHWFSIDSCRGSCVLPGLQGPLPDCQRSSCLAVQDCVLGVCGVECAESRWIWCFGWLFLWGSRPVLKAKSNIRAGWSRKRCWGMRACTPFCAAFFLQVLQLLLKLSKIL